MAIGRRGLTGKSSYIQNGIHELSRRVSSKRTTGAIRAVRAGSESKHENTRAWIAEARNRLTPIFMIAVSPALLARNALAIFDQAWTARTNDDFGIENLEPAGKGHAHSLYLVRGVFDCVSRTPSSTARCSCFCCCSWGSETLRH